jgi:anaerobic selenocysteine-containing dehydrogenase
MGEAKPNAEVFRLLAERLGFEEECFRDSDDEIIRQAISSGHATLEGITLERLKRDGWARLNLPEVFAPFADGGFKTPSGKCEFYSPRLASMGLDPVPDFIPPRESPATAPRLAERYPIQLLSPPAHSFLNSSFSHLKTFIKAERRPTIEISADDARARAISEGDLVRVWNDRGECRLYAAISDRVKTGVAVALSIWWNKLSPGSGNVNATVSEAVTDMGEGATFYDNLVEIAKA